MAEKTISLEFDGYWLDTDKSVIPAEPGIYCVYECRYSADKDTVSLHALIYIGEAVDARDRINNHEKYQDWLNHVRTGNELCYSFGPIGSTDRERVEAALIFKHKPPENAEYKNSFPFDRTTISLSGKTALLHTFFTVERTE